MSMYRFWQREEDTPWHPVIDSPKVYEEVKAAGAKKLTILSVSEPIGIDSDTRGLKYQGPLYFDIDAEGELATAISSAKALVERLLKEFEVPEEAIQVFCSGKKGLHILVAQRAFMRKTCAVRELPAIFRAMAQKLYVTGLDLKPYALGRGNSFRLPSVQRFDGNYRVPISIHQLFSLTEAIYREMVKAPQKGRDEPEYKGTVATPLHILYTECAERVDALEKERTDRSKLIVVKNLELIAEAPPCVESIIAGKVKGSVTFNTLALNLALWASRSGASDGERTRVFQQLADSSPPSERYPTARSRMAELVSMYKYALHSSYSFGCAYMRACLKTGGEVCKSCPLENHKDDGESSADTSFFSDLAARVGIIQREDGYYRAGVRGHEEPLSTFILAPQSAFMGKSVDGTGDRRRSTLCKVMRNGKVLGQVVMDEGCWANKAAFVRALEGLQGGIYFLGGDLDIPKIKLLVFLEEEAMSEVKQAVAVGIHLDLEEGREVATYVEEGRSLDSLRMVDTYRLSRKVAQSPELFKVPELKPKDSAADEAFAGLCSANKSIVCAVSVGWFLACFLKMHIHEIYGQFPLLSLWGQAGSGKSKFTELLGALHGVNYLKQSKTNCGLMNRFNAVELFSSSTTVPRICEEYNKGRIADKEYLMLEGMFMALYGMEAAQRGVIEPGSRTATQRTIPLTAPACILSEQQIKSPAMQERTLIAKMQKDGRNPGAFEKAMKGRYRLMSVGQQFMKEALRTTKDQVYSMVEKEAVNVSTDFDDRVRFNLRVVHMALNWGKVICQDLSLTASWKVLTDLKSALTELTLKPKRQEEILNKNQRSEVDLFILGLSTMAAESGLALQQVKQGQPRTRPIWLTPGQDFKVAGDLMYLDTEVVHSRYLEWMRSTGKTSGNVRSPLEAHSDLQQLLESEPYFEGWKEVPGMAFGARLASISISKIEKLKGVDISRMRKVHDALMQLDAQTVAGGEGEEGEDS